LEQIALAIFGVTATWLSQDKEPSKRKYAPLFGLIGQPFWFYTAYVNQQRGIFILCFFYTYSWWRGVRTYWIK
jgi:hypothetical protein